MRPHPLTNFEIQKYYQNKPKFNGVYSRNNWTKIKDEAYIINLDEYISTGTHWIALYVNTKNVTHFNSFGIEHIPKEFKKLIGNKSIITKIYKIQTYDLIMCIYFCIGFIGFMFKVKSLLNNTNLFSSNDYEKIDKIKLNYFQ